MADTMTITHIYPQPDDQVRIKLVKNSKGYGFEIGVAGKTPDEALATLRDVEQKVRAEFTREDV